MSIYWPISGHNQFHRLHVEALHLASLARLTSTSANLPTCPIVSHSSLRNQDSLVLSTHLTQLLIPHSPIISH